MKALILNSGLGKRMGVLTSEHPKCMTEIDGNETILSRQLNMLAGAGVTEIVMTTGLFDDVLVNYCNSLELPIKYTFVKNEKYAETNYIYSIYMAKEYLKGSDIIMLHGDLVFSNEVLDAVVASERSVMTVSSTAELPQKDFKAVIDGEKITAVGIEFFNSAVAAQPLYMLKAEDFKVWLDNIVAYCESGKVSCYAENAFNEISDKCNIYTLDVEDKLCCEIDTPEDLAVVSAKVKELKNKKVYMCFSTDILHSGHMEIIKKAAKLGKLIIGVLSDEAVASYKRFPLLPFEERKALFENIAGVYKVVEQKSLSYGENLLEIKPDYVVHGDDWREGIQKPIRDEVVPPTRTPACSP